MRIVKRTIDIGHRLTKFVNFHKADGTILYSSIPSIVRKYTANTESKFLSSSPFKLNSVSVFGQHYLVGSKAQGKLFKNSMLESRRSYFEHYLALLSSATSLMDENIIDELILTAPLSRLAWLQSRINDYVKKPISYPNNEPVIVKAARVVPSCYGSFLNFVFYSNKTSSTNNYHYMLIDLGGQLAEWLPIQGSRPILKHSGFMTISRESSGDESLLNVAAVAPKFTRLAKRLIPAIKKSHCNAILLTGGRAPLYEQSLRQALKGMPVITAPDNIFANVLGYQRNLNMNNGRT